MIQAIVFDVGGVLIGLDMGRCIRAFEEDLGFARIRELLDPYHQKGIYGELEEGILPAGEFRRQILAESRPGARPEEVDHAMGQLITGVDPRTVQVLLRLRENYPLYLGSNNNPISMPMCLEEMRRSGLDPDKTFKGQFISCELKCLKPSRAFYEAIIRGVGLPADEILFIDDNGTNVDAAREAGLQARLYVAGTDLSLLLSDC